MNDLTVMSPFMQLGALGMSFLLLALVCWLIRQFVQSTNRHSDTLVAVQRETLKVVALNTEATNKVATATETQGRKMDQILLTLARRPRTVPAGERDEPP